MPDYANIPDHIQELPELADPPAYPSPTREVFLTQPFQNWLIHPHTPKSMKKIAKRLLQNAFSGPKESSIPRLKDGEEKNYSLLGNYINHGLQNRVPCRWVFKSCVREHTSIPANMLNSTTFEIFEPVM